MMSIKHDTLHKLYLSRPTARELFASILEGGVEEGRTTVDELIEGNSATRRQAITLLRDLDDAGCGEFKVGRKGHPSRLEWSADPYELAKQVVSGEFANAAPVQTEPASEALGQELLEISNERGPGGASASQGALELPLDTERVEPGPGPAPLARSSQPAPARREAPSAPASEGPRASILHTHVLRVNTRVSIELPADLTRREAEVLADWIRNLSFER